MKHNLYLFILCAEQNLMLYIRITKMTSLEDIRNFQFVYIIFQNTGIVLFLRN